MRQEEFPSHKGCKNRLRVCWVGPKIHERYSRSGRRMLSHPAEELHDSIDGEAVYDVRDDHCVIAFRKRVCEEIARDNVKWAPAGYMTTGGPTGFSKCSSRRHFFRVCLELGVHNDYG